jgi:hypothetical protein
MIRARGNRAAKALRLSVNPKSAQLDKGHRLPATTIARKSHSFVAQMTQDVIAVALAAWVLVYPASAFV